MKLFESIELNIAELESAFEDCGDFVKRKIPVGENLENAIYVAYIDGMANKATIDDNILKPLMVLTRNAGLPTSFCNICQSLKEGGITTSDLTEADEFDKISTAVLSGDTAVFIDGSKTALIISSKGWPSRGVPAAETEVIVQGSKDAFSEGLRINTMLIRRRIRDTKLKVVQHKAGRRSQTDVALMYLDDVVRKDVLREAQKRLGVIDIDAVLDSGIIEQFIEDDSFSPFPQIQVTERPDKAASAILEGRIVIIVDNSPFVLIIPATANVFFQTSEDYNQRFEIMSLVRIVRFIAAFIAIAAPGLYIATAVYHPSMIPTLLTFKMTAARENVPFPAVIEILIMEFAFELLREAGIRLPGAVGGAVGIVGGLIIGQAAVDAGIVSPIVVIIVALTGIAGFAIPHYSLVSGFRLMKILIIASSAILGLFGFWASVIAILIHLSALTSFGFPYLYPYVSGGMNDYTDFKDSLIRLPVFMMGKRPVFANPEQQNRISRASVNTVKTLMK